MSKVYDIQGNLVELGDTVLVAHPGYMKLKSFQAIKERISLHKKITQDLIDEIKNNSKLFELQFINGYRLKNDDNILDLSNYFQNDEENTYKIIKIS